MRPASAGSRRLPPGKLGASTLRAPVRSSAPAGRRARSLHVFIDVRERRLDPRRPAFAGVFGPRALPRLLQIDVSTSTAEDHSNIPCQRNAWQGRLPVRSIVASRSSSRRRYAGSGAEDHRTLGAPSRDCSRERLRPDPDRFRLLASRALRVTVPGGGNDDRQSRRRRATLARHGRRQGPGTPDLREEIRCAGARGAFRRQAVRERGWTLEGRSRFEGCLQRLFHSRWAVRGTLAR